MVITYHKRMRCSAAARYVLACSHTRMLHMRTHNVQQIYTSYLCMYMLYMCVIMPPKQLVADSYYNAVSVRALSSYLLHNVYKSVCGGRSS